MVSESEVAISGVKPLPDGVPDAGPSTGPDRAPIAERQDLAHLETGKFLENRVGFVVLHIPWYGFRPQARLALDSGVSASAVSRLIRGKSQPSLAVALRVTRALSRRLGQPLDIFEVFSTDGHYPTPSVCVLTGCRSCLPPQAYDEEENLKDEYREVGVGEWSLSVSDRTGSARQDLPSQPL